MSEAILVCLIVVLMGGPLLLILTVGYLNTEAERARRDAEAAPSVACGNRFLAGADEKAQSSDRPTMADSMVAEIQSYLAEEQAMADEFVSKPTFEGLHRSSRKLTVRKAAN